MIAPAAEPGVAARGGGADGRMVPGLSAPSPAADRGAAVLASCDTLTPADDGAAARGGAAIVGTVPVELAPPPAGARTDGGEEAGHNGCVTRRSGARPSLPLLLAHIRGEYQRRQLFLQAETGLANQERAARRLVARTADPAVWKDRDVRRVLDGDAELAAAALRFAAPMLLARQPLHAQRLAHERPLRAYARLLPIWGWAEGVRGLGPLGLAQIVAEAGDLGSYRNPSCLWKRMGVGMHAGRIQRRLAGVSKEEALAMGFAPRRAAVMRNVAAGLVCRNGDGEYRAIYLAEKARQAALHPELTAGHIDVRARRYMVKRLLVHLWIEWRARADGGEG